MTTERNKWIDAIGRLITLTQERKLSWRSYPSEGYPSLSGIVEVVYNADHNGKTLRLYESKTRAERGMFPGSGEWETEAVLELVDSTGLSVWTFPHTDATEHLLGAVKYQVAGVGEFLEELLTA